MSGKRKDRHSLAGGSDLNTNPFAGLERAGLPAGRVPEQKSAPAPVKGGRVEVRREKAGRGGKTVTTLSAFATHHNLRNLESLLKELKQSCACGGTLKLRVLELQGDVCDRACAELEARGFKPVRAGG